MDKQSDVYMYPDVNGYIVCMACKINRNDRFFYYRKAALKHLHKHLKKKHRVPVHAFLDLHKEILDHGNEV